MDDRSYRDVFYPRYLSLHARRTPQSDTDRFLRSAIVPHLPPRTDARILDLGCGSGSLLAAMRNQGYANSVGVDISEESIESAIACGITTVELSDSAPYLARNVDSFDAIIGLDFIEHLSKREIVDHLELLWDSLTQHGVLILRIPNSSSMMGIATQNADLTHETAFTPRSARQALAAAGFVDCQVLPLPPLVSGIASAIRHLVWYLRSIAYSLDAWSQGVAHRDVLPTRNMLIVARRN